MATIFLPGGSYIDTGKGAHPPVLRFFGTGSWQWPGPLTTDSAYTTRSGWESGEVATYTAPDPPKELVPVNVLLPGIALTKAARIARKYKRAKRRTR